MQNDNLITDMRCALCPGHRRLIPHVQAGSGPAAPSPVQCRQPATADLPASLRPGVLPILRNAMMPSIRPYRPGRLGAGRVSKGPDQARGALRIGTRFLLERHEYDLQPVRATLPAPVPGAVPPLSPRCTTTAVQTAPAGRRPRAPRADPVRRVCGAARDTDAQARQDAA